MKPSVITKLRDFVPITALSRERAFRIAEMQATRFRVLTGNLGPMLPTEAIAELPYVQVERMGQLPVSGATAWSNGRWMVLLRASEPEGRQRFSLAHELKHIVDHRFIAVLYERIPADQRHAFIEQICDYFAGCLLVPRPVLQRLWKSGMQDVAQLAAEFGVSQPAIQTRLAQVGRSAPTTRCSVNNAEWLLPLLDSADSSAGSYNRSLHPKWSATALQGAPA